MDWQNVLTAAVVLVAVGFLGYKLWRVWGPTSRGCGGSCGCDSKRKA